MIKNKAIDLKKWVDEHRDLLKPPVGNKLVWQDADTIVMVVGGPNSRKDYHVNDGEEFFYQVEGDILLKIIDNGKSVDIPIKEGEIYLLRSKVPHCPTRPANTIGLVIEQKREDGEIDGFQWYCEKCHNKLHEEFAEITDIVKQLPPIFDKFYKNIELRTCKKCNHVMEPPKPPEKK